MTEPSAVPPHVEQSIKRSARSLSRYLLAIDVLLIAYGVWLRYEHQIATWVMVAIIGVALILGLRNVLQLTR